MLMSEILLGLAHPNMNRPSRNLLRVVGGAAAATTQGLDTSVAARSRIMALLVERFAIVSVMPAVSMAVATFSVVAR